MRKKEVSTCKENLDNIIDSFIENGRFKSGEMKKMRVSKLSMKSTVLRYFYHIKVVMTVQKTLQKPHVTE